VILHHILMHNPYLETRDALGGDMVFDNTPFLSAPLRENDKSEKLVIKGTCEFEHDTIVVSKYIFVDGEYSLEENHLEEPSVGGC